MRRIFLAALVLCLSFNNVLPAQNSLQKADELYDKGLFQDALKEYETGLKSADQEIHLKSLYRAAECQALLFRYGEAAQRVFDAKLPAGALWRGRFLILRAELAREFLKQYGFAAPRDVEEGRNDMTRRTPEQWRSEARSAYRQLWDLRRALVDAPIAGESYFVDLRDADAKLAPTLWDLVVLRWSEYLLSEETDAKPVKKIPANALLAGDYAGRWSSEESRGAQAAAIYEDAANLGGKGRAGIKELWKIRRVQLAERHGYFEEPANPKAFVDAEVSRLTGWLDSFRTPPGRSEAGRAAAELLNVNGRYADAVALCKRVEKDFASQGAAKHCAKLRASIELPQLNLTAKFVPPRSRDALSAYSRNLDKVYVRIYRTTPEDVLNLPRRYNVDGWSVIRQAEKDTVLAFLPRPTAYAWSTEVKPAHPYENTTTALTSPELEAGIYLAVVSNDERFAPGSSMMNAVFLNVTDLFMITSSGPQGPESDYVFDPAGPPQRYAPVLHFYTVDALTGNPVSSHIDAFERHDYGNAMRTELDTDDSGRAQLSADVPLVYQQSHSLSYDPLAHRGASYAYGSNPIYWGYGVPAPIEIFLETDRPIYRQGQEVRAKVTVLRRIPRGYKVYDGASLVNVVARDANGQELYKSDLKAGAMGTAQFRFTIGAGRMLGRYSINASLSDFGHSFGGYHNFQVEEYKRPEFEVEVKEADDAWKFGQTATVKGDAKYYFGGAVPDAPVHYKISRSVYIPWFCWWWRGFVPNYGQNEVATGDVKTDKDGNFSFTFTPQPWDPSQKDPYPASFNIEVESRDPGGRTITASKSFQAGAKAYLFDIAPNSGFLTAGKSAEIPIRLMNLNGKALAGKGTFVLHKLVGQPKVQEVENIWSGGFLESPSLEALYKDVPDGPEAGKGDLAFAGETPAPAKFAGLDEGVYRLTVSAKDPWGGESAQSIVLLAAGSGAGKKSLGLPNVTIPEHASYLVGETARVLMGSNLLDGAVYVEIWGGQYLLERQILSGGGVRLLEVPVTEAMKGGFTVRWFGAKGFKIRSGQARVDVPWKDRELIVKLRHNPVMKPGEKVTWSLSVFDADKKAAAGEAVVRVFDRSLEYYIKAAGAWISNLYSPRFGSGGAQGSLYQPWANQIPVEEGWIKKMMQLYYEAIAEPNPPMLRINKSRVYGYGNGGRFGGMMYPAAAASGGAMMLEGAARNMAMDAAGPASAPMKAMARAERGGKDEFKKAKEAGSPGEPPVQARSNFAETAYFEPQLPITAGKGVFTFTAPEQLTSWKIQAYALTNDVKRGTVEATAVTRKDLMVGVEMPRYFREGDEGTIKTVVHNETGRQISGEVSLVVTDTDDDNNGNGAAAKLGLENLPQSFAAVPRGLSALSWKVKAPRVRHNFKIKAIVRSGNLVDAEERDLPILPSRERLIETTIAALDGTMKKVLKLPVFYESDPTRINESMTLQIDPQLALSILNSLPSLIHYPYECTEQLLDRYVPLAITDSFYRKNPDLAQAVKKIPKRDTITPAWDRSDPRRLMQLMETPWEEISKGIKTSWPLIDMFDPKTVQGELMDSSSKLGRYQNWDGGFPWFPGGRSDPYMTLLVLAGFAEAQRYNVQVPMPIVQKALGYVNNEIPKHLKPNEADVALILYSAYVVTSYPKTTPGAPIGWQFAKVWADYADKHMEAMTPMGKAYAAYVYWRLGEQKKGDLYLDRAMDGARTDPIAGVYWAPEKISWLWYNDTVEKHAFLLRTLLAMRPKDKRIPGMVQWLLFNRKGNEWKSTKASAAAIFSLLDVLRSRGALSRGDAYNVSWGDSKEAAAVQPFDWLEKPLRWTKIGAEIVAKSGTATINKEGPGLAFASLTWIYTTDQLPKASGPGMIELSRRFFLRAKKGDEYHLTPLAAGGTVHVGDQIEVQLKINTRSQFEYVHLKDPKFAGFEAEELVSGWKWDQLSRYEEPRDSLTNFFIDWLPHGEYLLRYRLRPTSAGKYRLGAAVLQSMYAPEMSAHSDGFTLDVEE